ncbi:MAG: VOC family protein [Deltaproteobacteria bacterium]|nr:VOC family protein [Deltaproteobacteria bacterium]
MSEQKEPLVNQTNVIQVGFVVKDAEKAADYYTRNFGWGPWEWEDAEFKDYMFRGKKYDYARQKIALAFHDSVWIELIEPIEGETPASEFLREKGEGINHLHLGHVEDVDPILEKLATAGIEPAYRVNFEMSNGIVADALYLNTDDFGGVMFEFSQSPKDNT